MSTVSLARVIGPVISGFLFARVGGDLPYLAGGVAMVGVLILTIVLQRRVAAGRPGTVPAPKK